jgi:chromate transporter
MRLLVPQWSTLDPVAAAIAVAALVAMLRYHVSMLTTLGASAAAGLIWYLIAAN